MAVIRAATAKTLLIHADDDSVCCNVDLARKTTNLGDPMTGKAYENETVAAVFTAALTAPVHPVRVVDLDAYEANLLIENGDGLWFVRVREGARTIILKTTGPLTGQHDGAEATDADHETFTARLMAETARDPELIPRAFTSIDARAAWRAANGR
jgi:hypothetical protein